MFVVYLFICCVDVCCSEMMFVKLVLFLIHACITILIRNNKIRWHMTLCIMLLIIFHIYSHVSDWHTVEEKTDSDSEWINTRDISLMHVWIKNKAFIMYGMVVITVHVICYNSKCLNWNNHAFIIWKWLLTFHVCKESLYRIYAVFFLF